jgi:hypothetical protein
VALPVKLILILLQWAGEEAFHFAKSLLYIFLKFSAISSANGSAEIPSANFSEQNKK